MEIIPLRIMAWAQLSFYLLGFSTKISHSWYKSPSYANGTLKTKAFSGLHCNNGSVKLEKVIQISM